MRADERKREQNFGDEITIAHRINAVLRDRGEPQRLCQPGTRDWKSRSGNRARAEGERGRVRARRGQAFAIALQRPEVREHPMRAAHRLRALQVGVCRHDSSLEPRRLRDHRVLQRDDEHVEGGAGLHCPEARRGGDLIVAAATGVQTRSNHTGLFVQQPVDHRMNVFIGRDRLRAVGDARRDTVESPYDLRALVFGKHSGVRESGGPRLGEAHVVRPETEIDADRAVDGVERRVGAAGKAAAPQLVCPSSFFLALHTPATISSGFVDATVRAIAAFASPAASRSLSARTRCASPNSRMKPAASLCS